MAKREDMKKPTDALLEERVTEVQKYLLNGYTRDYILKATKAWNVTSRTIDNYIKAATDIIREINVSEREDNLAMIVQNQWEVFRACKTANNIGEARKVLMDIAKLRGLDVQIINAFVSERPLASISDEELDQALGGGDGRH